MDIIWDKPYTRLSSFLVGIAYGCYFHRKNFTKAGKSSKLSLYYGLIAFAISTWISSIRNNVIKSTWETAVHDIISSFLFCICSAWILYACSSGQGGVLLIYLSTLKSQKNWYRHAYANKEIWNQSEYGAAVGNAYIRQQVSDTVVRSVTAATMAGYQDLSEFERGVIVGAREMGHSICEVAMKFGFSRTTISRVYREYRESGKTSNLRHSCGRRKIVQERNQRRLTRIIKRDRRATLPQMAADFNAGPSTSVSVRTIQRNITDMGFRSRRPTRVSLMTARY
ncbi:hypothetical protein AVEN_131116-1 [Araneus ventricosus]|uniref:Transposase Tc1-like domain-containing protein n=1 Tax=Araneus ventricosus TaxID=182803 RepID=A0A4Y2GER4_ARAVE|nr:hypothetical protein AVEN_131116-1 [Araneus ventricosus]